jgi:hypothetical protein
VLFDRRKTEWGGTGVKRSATFHDGGDEESEEEGDEDSRVTDARARGKTLAAFFHCFELKLL